MDESRHQIGQIGVSKSKAVYENIKRRILLNQLTPDTALPELQLSDELGCGQSTVREALLRLSEDGLVTRTGYRGTKVSRSSAAEVREMMAIRTEIEAVGVRRAVTNIEPATFEVLSDLVGAMERAAAAGDLYQTVGLDREFHMVLFGAADLLALAPILMRCALHVHRYTITLPGSTGMLDDLAARHWTLVEILKARDADRAEAEIRNHIGAVLKKGAPEMARKSGHSA